MTTKTVQAIVSGRPLEDLDTLAIEIACPNCNTLRVFRFDHSMKAVLSREMLASSVAVTCSVCGVRHSVTFGWIKKSPGYSHRPLPTASNSFVEDSILLTPPEA